MKWTVLTLCALSFMLPLSGCTIPDNFGGVNWTPKAKLYTAMSAYKELKTNLVVLREQGKFTTAQANDIKTWMTAVEAIFDQWTAAVKLSQPTTTYPAQVDAAMLKLTTAQVAAERT